MAEVLVVVEAAVGETGTAPTVKKVTLEMLTLARALGEPSAVVLGAAGGAEAMAGTLAEHGAAKVHVAEGDDIDNFLVVPKADVLASLIQQVNPAAVLLAGSQEGKEIAGRLAVKLDNGLLVDVSEIDADGVATQVIFAGSVIVKSKVSKGIPLATVRPNSITPEPASTPGAAEQVPVEATVSDAAKKVKVVRRVAEQKGSRPELTEASIVVSGGRGVGSADNFKLIEELADSLGAAVGASRAATDSGFYPHQFQVGQTGKSV
ncbi:MAG: electron transfer flavoprotein subunit alpha/FixB family protein, partial [Micromonosporaceae bacterium]